MVRSGWSEVKSRQAETGVGFINFSYWGDVLPQVSPDRFLLDCDPFGPGLVILPHGFSFSPVWRLKSLPFPTRTTPNPSLFFVAPVAQNYPVARCLVARKTPVLYGDRGRV